MIKPTNFKSITIDYEDFPHQKKQVAQSKDKIISFLLRNIYLKDRDFSDFLFFSRDAYEHKMEKIIEQSNRKISVITIDTSIDSHSDSFSARKPREPSPCRAGI